MKSYKILSKNRTQAIIALFFMVISTNIISMQRAASLQTPEQRRATIARQVAFKKMQEQKEMTELLSTMVDPAVLKHHLVPQILEPVIKHLKAEIIKKNIFHFTVLAGHPAKIINPEFSKNGKILVTSCEGDKDNLIIWDVEKAQKLHAISVPNAPEAQVEIVVASPDGSKIIAASEITKTSDSNPELEIIQSVLTLWDAKTGKLIKQLDIPHDYVNEITFSVDGKQIIVVGAPAKIITDANINDPESKGYIYIADAHTGNTIVTHEIINNFPDIIKNPNGNTIVVRSDIDLNLYDVNTGKLITKLDGPTQKIYQANYSTDGKKIIASDTLAETVFIWDGQTGKQLQQFNIPGVTSAVTLNSDATKMLTTNFNDTLISVWDTAAQSVINTIDPMIQVYSVQFSPDNTMIAATRADIRIAIWNATSGEQLFTAPGDDFAFSSDSKRIQTHVSPAENEEKCSVTLWNTATKQQIKTFVADHDLFEMTPNFYNVVSPDDNNDHNFILWTPYTPEERAAFAKMNDLTMKQAHYLHQLYTTKLRKLPVSTADSEEFKSLPVEIQIMITRYLSSSSISMQPKINVPKSVTPPVTVQPVAIQRPARQIAAPTKPTPAPAPAPVEPTKPQSWWQWMTTGW